MSSSKNNNEFDIYQKKILILAKRRGIKELDLLLGSFADYFVSLNPNISQLELFEELLLLEDALLFKYLFTPAIPSESFIINPVWEKLLAFKKDKIM